LKQAAFGSSVSAGDKTAITSLEESLDRAIASKDMTKAVAPSSTPVS